MSITCKMVSCNNKSSVGYSYLDITGNLSNLKEGSRFRFNDLNSSLIQKIDRHDNLITITTNNTIYVFEEKPNDS